MLTLLPLISNCKHCRHSNAHKVQIFWEGHKKITNVTNTVGINPTLSDLNTPWTSKLCWRYFEANKINRNELHIRKKSQKGTGTKKGWKIEQFWKIWKKEKNQISALLSTQTPPDNWPDALDCLTKGLVAYKHTKLGKTNENLILSLGLSYIKIPLW